MFLVELQKVWKQMTCNHNWQFAGVGDDKESRWYWHYEKCNWCEQERELMNNNTHDACGHTTDTL